MISSSTLRRSLWLGLAILAFLPLDVQVSTESNRVYRDERLPYAAYGFEDRDYTHDDRYEHHLTGLARELDTPFANTALALRDLGTRAFLRDDYHLNAVGHRAVATALRDPVERACARASRESGVSP